MEILINQSKLLKFYNFSLIFRPDFNNCASFRSLFLVISILSALTWSTFPIAHSAPLDETRLTLNCHFNVTVYNSQDYYTCNVYDLVNNRQDAVIAGINGNHVTESGNSNVKALIIDNQNVTFLPMKIGEFFENLEIFEVRNSSLLEIDVADLVNLEVLSINDNNITNLNPNVFKNLTNLKTFSAKNNKIEKLAENLFENNKKLEKIIFSNNNLTDIFPQTFEKLENLKHFDFTNNSCLIDLNTVDEDVFTVDEMKNIFEEFCYKIEEEVTSEEPETTEPTTPLSTAVNTTTSIPTTVTSKLTITTPLPSTTTLSTTTTPIFTTTTPLSTTLTSISTTTSSMHDSMTSSTTTPIPTFSTTTTSPDPSTTSSIATSTSTLSTTSSSTTPIPIQITPKINNATTESQTIEKLLEIIQELQQRVLNLEQPKVQNQTTNSSSFEESVKNNTTQMMPEPVEEVEITTKNQTSEFEVSQVSKS